LQLERGNISNALTDNFLVDVGITQDQFNTGQALLYLGIILLEIPSNYCLQLLGPSIWISSQVFAFGLVATLQSFQKGYGGYLASRIMLGVVECGYIPGTLGGDSICGAEIRLKAFRPRNRFSLCHINVLQAQRVGRQEFVLLFGVRVGLCHDWALGVWDLASRRPFPLSAWVAVDDDQ
jgi:hypothetical protein